MSTDPPKTLPPRSRPISIRSAMRPPGGPSPRSVVATLTGFGAVVLAFTLMSDVNPDMLAGCWLWGSVLIVLLGLGGRVRDLERFISERQEVLEGHHERLRSAALTDPVTGLPNRRHLIERLEEELDRAQRHGQSLGCLFLDVDNFAAINNTYLHEAGDAILASLAGVLRRQLRTSDVLGRYGGDEFVILLPEVKPTEISAVAERIRAAVERHRFRVLPPGTPVTISVGAAKSCVDQKEDYASLLRRADEALYRAKEDGRNAVCVDDSLASNDGSGTVPLHGMDTRDEPRDRSRAASRCVGEG